MYDVIIVSNVITKSDVFASCQFKTTIKLGIPDDLNGVVVSNADC
jgi:hypothetical protein